ncbi:molecular chaperone DnaK (HSP70) [Allocatelliglobosispora scoriae]|uniref:Molecular chaperone DnaK (HSP70) n=1 Tax=Allocatelliglobosispora scoriae TaxID=643052 RepID=A0A841BSE7_9ACTN|nr:Hsp70 family protein [Allocatelliglobosispora scoriae]MBB5869652.1 molecular chaperone DnaK (HSP70) [Allocatelliglobosispora scoriae]
MKSEKTPGVGLDFGTSTTLVASPHGVVPIGDTSTWMPSVVGHDDSGTAVVGEQALELRQEQVVRSVKRAITEGSEFVRVDSPNGPGNVRADDLIIAIMREAAARGSARGQEMSDPDALRLGCPAMWDGGQRRRLVELARRAGLPVTLASLVDEPVAAGIAWLAGRPADAAGPLRVVVFDMGGGTLDIAVLDVSGAEHHDVAVLAAIGIDEAGDTLDDAIADDLEFVLAAAGVDIGGLANPRRARARLPYAARAAKIGLTTETEFDVKLSRREFGIASVGYRRDQLDEAFEPQMDRAELYVGAALRAARLTERGAASAHDVLRMSIDELVEDVDVVVLSGGMSQIPYVAQRLAALFPPTTRIETACTPSENAVALGLAQATRYGRINMYRPALDILLEWDGGQQSRTVYDAYTPLIAPGQLSRGGRDLRFIRTGRELDLPPSGTGRLRVVAYADDGVPATLGGTDLDGFPVALSDQAFEFSIFPDGRIRLIDAGGAYEGHVTGADLRLSA